MTLFFNVSLNLNQFIFRLVQPENNTKYLLPIYLLPRILIFFFLFALILQYSLITLIFCFDVFFFLLQSTSHYLLSFLFHVYLNFFYFLFTFNPIRFTFFYSNAYSRHTIFLLLLIINVDSFVCTNIFKNLHFQHSFFSRLFCLKI